MEETPNQFLCSTQTDSVSNQDQAPTRKPSHRILVKLLTLFVLLLCLCVLISLGTLIIEGFRKLDKPSFEPSPESPPEESTLDAGDKLVLEADGIEYAFRWCPAGEYEMGSPVDEQDRHENEKQHHVKIPHGFWLLETEVTQEMWENLMGANLSKLKAAHNPVENVSWDDCQNFCQILSKKLGVEIMLPTEAQWEYACRAGTTEPFADDLDSMAWFSKNSDAHPHEVGKTKPNAWGLFDMHGNVFEWCSDLYDPNYSDSLESPPESMTFTSDRVYRGGSWRSSASDCRSAHRGYNAPDKADDNRGLRVLFVPGNVKTDVKVELPKGPAAGTRKVWQANGVEYAFRWCPPGEFMMGSPDDEPNREKDEQQHKVVITEGFWLLETEVTQHMWKSIMGKNPSHHRGLGPLGLWKNYNAGNHPVESVNWYVCQEFCRKLSAKLGETVDLPTEAQWEYACRAGSTGAYAGDVNSMAWHKANYNKNRKTSEVAKKKPNSWGLYDMHGNVWEWCSDWYDAKYAPEKTKDSQKRVTRGGGWDSPSTDCRSAKRSSSTPDSRFYSLGLRVLIVPRQVESDAPSRK